MICKNCGNELEVDSILCSNCGKYIDSESQSEIGIEIEGTKEHSKGISDEEILKQERTPLSASEKVKRALKNKKVIFVIVAVCILVFSLAVGISKGLESRKEKLVQSYIDRMAPVVDEKRDNFKSCLRNAEEYLTADFNSDGKFTTRPKTKAERSRDVRKAVVAGFDALEVCLDYYKGLISVRGEGDYSYINNIIEKTITDVEQCYTSYEDFIPTDSLREYKNRMLQIRTEWRSMKQNY